MPRPEHLTSESRSKMANEEGNKRGSQGARHSGGSHLSILATLIQRLEYSSATGFWNLEHIGFVEEIGKEALQATILGSINGDIEALMDTTKFDLATLRLCDTRTARQLPKPGVYIHAIYHPATPTSSASTSGRPWY